MKKSTQKVFFEVSADGQPLGRIEFALFNHHVPLTAENFRSLCVGDNPKGLVYTDSPMHRVIPGFMCQGGDITHGNGRGGESIYGRTFEDEFWFKTEAGMEVRRAILHECGGLLSMANSGAHTNGSQFFITTNKTPWLNGKHVVFGIVTQGFEVVEMLESLGSQSGATSKKVMVTQCGEVADKKKD